MRTAGAIDGAATQPLFGDNTLRAARLRAGASILVQRGFHLQPESLNGKELSDISGL